LAYGFIRHWLGFALIQLVHKNYPFRDLSVVSRMDVGKSHEMELRDGAAHTKPKYAPEVGINLVNSRMQGNANNLAPDLRTHLAHFKVQDAQGLWPNCRAEVYMPNMMYFGGGECVVWLFRLPSVQQATAIENKYTAWLADQTATQIDWLVFRRSNVVGVVTGGDNQGRSRRWVRSQYLHQREKK